MSKLPTWLTEKERERLLTLETSTRDKAILTTFLYAGLRSNELRMLDVEDIDFDAKQITVRYGKRSKQRLLPLHAICEDALRALIGERETGPIFTGVHGERISNRGLRYLINDLGKRAHLRKELHPHALRHTFAVSLLEAGIDLEMIRDLLGHASIQTTSLYLHCTTQRKRLAIDKLNGYG